MTITGQTAPVSHAWTRFPDNSPRDDMLDKLDAWWRAANYLSLGQIYLLDNPLLREPLRREHVKPRLLGHWGTTPGLNFVYAHLNRAIRERDLNAIFVTGPGHGGPGLVANAYLDGTYSEVYDDIDASADGLRKLFRQFSFPGGIPSHVAPETPGSIHEGGELGYSLSHAYGAVFDNPDLLVATVVGDGEAETGPLATSWHANKFVDPLHDGVVLPILHLNGFKIANPSILARIPESELLELMRGYGYTPHVVSGGFDGEDPREVHRRFAVTLDEVLNEIADIKTDALAGTERGSRPRWPMIILRTPKGWTCPAVIDGHPSEGNWRSHQVPLPNARDTDEHLALLEEWLRSYRPDELFDHRGEAFPLTTWLAPNGASRMSANPVANGGLLRRDLLLPDFRASGVDVPSPGSTTSEATRVLGSWLRDVALKNPTTFRIFGPDETASNRLQDVVEATNKQWNGGYDPIDDLDNHLARAGRVVEMLSEHQCEGWLEGYLLTGRHGLLNSYEAFIHIVDSMVGQHAKWLKSSRRIPWRRSVSSLNILLSSHVWRQDHNGASHQDPGFLDHVVSKKADVVRVYLPFDANTLLSTLDHCLRSTDYINVIVAGKQPAPNWLTMQQGTGGRGARRRPRLRRRRSHAGGPGGRVDPAAARTVAHGARRQRRRPDAPREVDGPPARVERRRLRRPVHRRPARDLRLSRVSGARAPAHLLAARPRQPARARVSRRGHDDDAVRHADDERPRPVPPRDRRARPRAGSRCARGCAPSADAGCADQGPSAHPRPRRRRPRHHRVELGAHRLTGPEADASPPPRRARFATTRFSASFDSP
jgi:xylulose-5-phosphate/fructose-6-phosphate phosphoketolase